MSFNGDQYPNFAAKVITTRGDIVRGSSTGERERLGLGSANQVLQSDGTDIDWETLALADSTLTTQGDILYQNASGLARLGQSTDGYVLTTKGAAANPVWAAAGATVTTQSITPTDDQTTTNEEYEDVANASLTLASRSNGYCMITALCAIKNTSSANIGLAINYNGANQVFAKQKNETAGGEETVTVSAMDSLDGGTVKLQWRVSTGTGTMSDDSTQSSRLFLFEVS